MSTIASVRYTVRERDTVSHEQARQRLVRSGVTIWRETVRDVWEDLFGKLGSNKIILFDSVGYHWMSGLLSSWCGAAAAPSH